MLSRIQQLAAAGRLYVLGDAIHVAAGAMLDEMDLVCVVVSAESLELGPAEALVLRGGRTPDRERYDLHVLVDADAAYVIGIVPAEDLS